MKLERQKGEKAKEKKQINTKISCLVNHKITSD